MTKDERDLLLLLADATSNLIDDGTGPCLMMRNLIVRLKTRIEAQMYEDELFKRRRALPQGD